MRMILVALLKPWRRLHGFLHEVVPKLKDFMASWSDQLPALTTLALPKGHKAEVLPCKEKQGKKELKEARSTEETLVPSSILPGKKKRPVTAGSSPVACLHATADAVKKGNLEWKG